MAQATSPGLRGNDTLRRYDYTCWGCDARNASHLALDSNILPESLVVARRDESNSIRLERVLMLGQMALVALLICGVLIYFIYRVRRRVNAEYPEKTVENMVVWAEELAAEHERGIRDNRDYLMRIVKDLEDRDKYPWLYQQHEHIYQRYMQRIERVRAITLGSPVNNEQPHSERDDTSPRANLDWTAVDPKTVAENQAHGAAKLRQKAEQGDVEAQYLLGIGHAAGFGAFQQDNVQAVTWYRKAAEQGHVGAQLALGTIYEEGSRVTKDDTEAVAWFRKAAEQDNADGQYDLGRMYEFGSGVAKDDVQAATWYRKAAEQGNAEAKKSLNRIHPNSDGDAEIVAPSWWYRKKAEQGDAAAQFVLGGMYAEGNGVPKDDASAATWYRKAAEQGFAAAQLILGGMYKDGNGLAKDGTLAVAWYRKAAESEAKILAQFHLGQMYQLGDGVPKDDVTAATW